MKVFLILAYHPWDQWSQSQLIKVRKTSGTTVSLGN